MKQKSLNSALILLLLALLVSSVWAGEWVFIEEKALRSGWKAVYEINAEKLTYSSFNLKLDRGSALWVYNVVIRYTNDEEHVTDVQKRLYPGDDGFEVILPAGHTPVQSIVVSTQNKNISWLHLYGMR